MSHAIREIGIPVRSVNWVRLHADQNSAGEPALYASMGQESEPPFVLQIDPRDGRCRQFGADVDVLVEHVTCRVDDFLSTNSARENAS